MPAKKKTTKIANNDNLVRDSFSKGIINTDRSSYMKAKARRKFAKKKEEELVALKDKCADLESKYDDLIKIIDKLSKKKS